MKKIKDISDAVHDCFTDNEDYGLPSKHALVDLLTDMMRRIQILEAEKRKSLTKDPYDPYS